MHHAGAFRHAGHVEGCAWVGGEGEGSRDEFGEGVSCADCAGGGEPMIVRGTKIGDCSGDFGEDFGDGKTTQDQLNWELYEGDV